MKKKIFIICILMCVFMFFEKSYAKYILNSKVNAFRVKSADNIKPYINNRNYNVYDEIFNDNVKIEISDNIGIKRSEYYFNEFLDTEITQDSFESGKIFEKSGYYKIKVIDLYENVTEYSFIIDKEINEVEINLNSENSTQFVTNIIVKDELSGVDKIEVYVDEILYKEYNYIDENVKNISEEVIFLLDTVNFYQDVYVVAYDKLGNIEKSESIILNVDKIYDIVDIYRFRDVVNNQICDFENKTVYLINNIELNLNETNDWNAISGFKGEFDGKKHTISGFYMDKDIEKTAFFENNYGIIRNLTISGEINTTKNISAGICAENYGKIINCRSRVKINSNGSYIGGISGINYGIIEGSRNNSHITTLGNFVGGIVGYNKAEGKILKTGSSGRMTGTNYIGGICGFCEGSENEISLSFNMGNITGLEYIGGICGGTDDKKIIFRNIYNRGNVIEESANGNNGGIIGINSPEVYVYNGYNLGEITSTYSNQIGPENIKFDNIFYIKDKVNVSNIGIAKEEFLFKELIENENSILFLLEQKASGIWLIKYGNNDGYPMFVWQFE